jgi:hypothetical protein
MKILARMVYLAGFAWCVSIWGQTGSGSLFITSGPSVVYGNGAAPHLQSTLIHLNAALNQLGSMTPLDNQGYFQRTTLGVDQAIADVKLAIDTAEGRTPSAAMTWPSLPMGLGNASSGLIVAASAHPAALSPQMESVILNLKDAMNELGVTDPSNKGIFLPRAVADVTFALDNANASMNVAAGAPAVMQPTVGITATVASAPKWAVGNNAYILTGLVLVIIAMVAGVAELAFRGRTKR